MLNALKFLSDWRAVLPTAIIAGAAPIYFCGAISWQILGVFLPKKWFTYVDHKMYSFYQRLVLFFFENVSGVQITLYGDVEACFSQRENVLYISNHQTAVDWVIANMVSIRQGSLGYLSTKQTVKSALHYLFRYVLKDALQYIPLYGWYFYQHGCVYVRRKGSFRPDIANRELEYLADKDLPVWLVIFPEGTRYYIKKEKEITSSVAYAQSQGLQPLKHHLTPRVRGVHLALSKLHKKLDALYDISIAYSSSRESTTGKRLDAPNMFKFVCNPTAIRVHIHIKRYPIAEVPLEEDVLQRWLHDRFIEKDRYLEKFFSPSYKEGDEVFPNLVIADSCLPLRSTLPSFIFFTAVLIPSIGTSFYWKVWLVGSLGSFMWMKIRSAA